MTPRKEGIDRGDHDWLAKRFEEHRTHLRAVGYRMLGSLSEADDAGQEAWLTLSRSDAAVAPRQRGGQPARYGGGEHQPSALPRRQSWSCSGGTWPDSGTVLERYATTDGGSPAAASLGVA